MAGTMAVGMAVPAMAADDDEVIELEFWGWWSSDARKPYIEEMVEGFNESQDAIHVTYVDIGWDEIFTKNIAQIAAGNPCDVMANNFGDVSYRAEQGQLTALDDYLDDDYNLDLFFDSYAEGCYGEDGSVYAIPLVGDTRFIYYNKELLAEAGYSEENGNLPTTWDELQEVAFAVDSYNDDGSIDVMGFHPILGNGGLDTWITNANSGNLWYDPEANDFLIDTENNVRALENILSYTEHYTQRTVDDYTAAFSSGMADPFCSGKLAMVVQTNAYRAAIKKNAPDLDYGIILMPEMEEGTGNWSNGGGFTIEVPYGAKNPEASMEFIKWMTSPDIQAYWALNMGEVPTLKEVDNEELNEDVVYLASLESMQQTNIGLYPNNIAGFKDLIHNETDLILLGSESVEEGLETADTVVRDTYELE
jgi:multiple sugar transport system substrate-binding protein